MHVCFSNPLRSARVFESALVFESARFIFEDLSRMVPVYSRVPVYFLSDPKEHDKQRKNHFFEVLDLLIRGLRESSEKWNFRGVFL